jgi:D-glycero-D-manno-heptose 1,7-bisphosphate phosphatase
MESSIISYMAHATSEPNKKHRTVFIDRDGTIARDVNYCSRPEDFEIFNGVPEAIKKLNAAGFKVIVITNQSGIARGIFTEEMLGKIHKKMCTEMEKHGARIDDIEYCPHHPDDNCDCRKPKTGLFRRAAQKLDIDFPHSFMIGDMSLDIEAGKAVGCRTVLVVNGTQTPTLKTEPDFTAQDFKTAVAWILAQR